VFGDAQEEASLAFVACAHVRRSDESRRNSVANAAEVSDRPLEAIPSWVRNESCNVLAEEQSRTKRRDDSPNVGPQVTLITGAEALPGRAVRRARPARNDRVHDATPRRAVEGFDISPDRRVIQETVLHRLDQMAGSEGFPLHVTDRASICDRESESNIEAAPARAEGEGAQFVGR
jgi:hypothetical protein